MKTLFKSLLIALALALSASAVTREFSQTSPIDLAPKKPLEMAWFQGESVTLNLRAVSRGVALDLSATNLVLVWDVASWTNRSVVYLATTGLVSSVSNAVIRFDLPPDQSNLSPGNYAGYVRALSISDGTNLVETAVLAVQSIEVLYGMDGRHYDLVGPLTYAVGTATNALSLLGLTWATATMADLSGIPWSSFGASNAPVTETTNTMLKSVFARAHGESNPNKVDHAYYADEAYLAQYALSASSATLADSATTASTLGQYGPESFILAGSSTFDVLLNGGALGSGRTLHLQGSWSGVSNINGEVYIPAPEGGGDPGGEPSSAALAIRSSGTLLGTVTALNFNAQFGVSVTDGVASITGIPAGTIPETAIGTNKLFYYFTGADQYAVVPGNVSQMLVKAWGGAGGVGSGGYQGGYGGFSYAIIPVAPLETLTLRVAGGGISGTIVGSGGLSATSLVWGGGGYHSVTTQCGNAQVSSGGGASWVIRNSTTNVIPAIMSTSVLEYASVLLVAGGGGSGINSGGGGQGGGLSGGAATVAAQGQGGTQTDGGIGGVGTNYLSGTFGFAQCFPPAAPGSGAGGGGWYGGGGCGRSGLNGGGGGGGSGYIAPGLFGGTWASTFSFDVDYKAGIANISAGQQAGHGMIMIQY